MATHPGRHRGPENTGIEPPRVPHGGRSGRSSIKHSLWLAIGAVFAFAADQVPALEVYKWTDARGKVHYGDRPETAGSKKIEVKVDKPMEDATATARDERTRKLLEQYEIERGELAAGRARKAEAEAERKKNCAMAQDILDNYRTASYLYDKDKNGERVVLTTPQRQAAEAEARKAVDTWCKPAP